MTRSEDPPPQYKTTIHRSTAHLQLIPFIPFIPHLTTYTIYTIPHSPDTHLYLLLQCNKEDEEEDEAALPLAVDPAVADPVEASHLSTVRVSPRRPIIA